MIFVDQIFNYPSNPCYPRFIPGFAYRFISFKVLLVFKVL
jgi:hypothetical protein